MRNKNKTFFATLGFAKQVFALSNSETSLKTKTLCEQCGGGPHKPEFEKP